MRYLRPTDLFLKITQAETTICKDYSKRELANGIKSSLTQRYRPVFVIVLNLRDETRLEKCHLYAAYYFCTTKSCMVMRAVRFSISTVLDDVPTELFIWMSYLRFRKKISMACLA